MTDRRHCRLLRRAAVEPTLTLARLALIDTLRHSLAMNDALFHNVPIRRTCRHTVSKKYRISNVQVCLDEGKLPQRNTIIVVYIFAIFFPKRPRLMDYQ